MVWGEFHPPSPYTYPNPNPSPNPNPNPNPNPFFNHNSAPFCPIDLNLSPMTSAPTTMVWGEFHPPSPYTSLALTLALTLTLTLTLTLNPNSALTPNINNK